MEKLVRFYSLDIVAHNLDCKIKSIVLVLKSFSDEYSNLPYPSLYLCIDPTKGDLFGSDIIACFFTILSK